MKRPMAQELLTLKRSMAQGLLTRKPSMAQGLLRTFATASPPDVRRGSAPPFSLQLENGLCPWSGLCPKLLAKGRTRGQAPGFLQSRTAGQSPASHPAAEPMNRGPSAAAEPMNRGPVRRQSR
jgi:hypothetical protein